MKRFVFRTFGAAHTLLYRLSGGKVGGRMRGAPVLLLTVTGRKSGKRRTTPLLYGRQGDSYVLIASAGGSPKNPAWYLNLEGQDAEVEVGREHVRVRARDAEAEEHERLWAQMVGLYPQYADYQQKTTRRIPVVVLEPVRP